MGPATLLPQVPRRDDLPLTAQRCSATSLCCSSHHWAAVQTHQEDGWPRAHEGPAQGQPDNGPCSVPVPHRHSLTSWSSAEGAGTVSSEADMQTGYAPAPLAMVILR